MDHWDLVRCASDGKLFSSSYYRFATTASAGNGSIQQKFYWQKTRNSKLGSSTFAVRDYKLLNEENESVVAVYSELSGSWTKSNTTLKDKITLHGELGEVAQATAVLCFDDDFVQEQRGLERP
jgi:hypothetical protein